MKAFLTMYKIHGIENIVTFFCVTVDSDSLLFGTSIVDFKS